MCPAHSAEKAIRPIRPGMSPSRQQDEKHLEREDQGCARPFSNHVERPSANWSRKPGGIMFSDNGCETGKSEGTG